MPLNGGIPTGVPFYDMAELACRHGLSERLLNPGPKRQYTSGWALFLAGSISHAQTGFYSRALMETNYCGSLSKISWTAG